MTNPFEKFKKKMQFQAYVDGYSEGYQKGVTKCHLEIDGRTIPIRNSDISLQSQYCKRPKHNFLYFPWYDGFELGYTEALSWYNAGDDPKDSGDESINDMIDRLRVEFDRRRYLV